MFPDSALPAVTTLRGLAIVSISANLTRSEPEHDVYRSQLWSGSTAACLRAISRRVQPGSSARFWADLSSWHLLQPVLGCTTLSPKKTGSLGPEASSRSCVWSRACV